MSEAELIHNGEMQQQSLPLAFIHGEAVIETPQDLFIPPDALEIILESFEGPLDLLLYLIRKQKFDIANIPIAEITRQYMEYVQVMRMIKLELAAEYLVMAAILAEIKSRILLPKIQQDDEEVDPRAELIRRLQEYEVIKNAAQRLEQLPRVERDLFVASATVDESITPKVIQPDIDLAELVVALGAVLKRVDALEHHHIKREHLSTRERMTEIMAALQTSEYLEFTQLFNLNEGKSGVVVTFLAVLELVKESLIDCIQANVFGQIHVKRRLN